MKYQKGILYIFVCLAAFLLFSGCAEEETVRNDANEVRTFSTVDHTFEEQSRDKSFAGAYFTEIDGRMFCGPESTIQLSADGDNGTRRDISDAFDLALSPPLGGNAKITFHSAAVYEDYASAGIPPEELCSDYFSAREDISVIIADISVTNDNIDFPDDSPDNDFNISLLAPAYLGNKTDEQLIEEYGNWLPYNIDYFSGHGTGETDYYHFRVEKGKTDDFQVGFAVHNSVLENKEMALRIGASKYGKFYFDMVGIVDEE